MDTRRQPGREHYNTVDFISHRHFQYHVNTKPIKQSIKHHEDCKPRLRCLLIYSLEIISSLWSHCPPTPRHTKPHAHTSAHVHIHTLLFHIAGPSLLAQLHCQSTCTIQSQGRVCMKTSLPAMIFCFICLLIYSSIRWRAPGHSDIALLTITSGGSCRLGKSEGLGQRPLSWGWWDAKRAGEGSKNHIMVLRTRTAARVDVSTEEDPSNE